MEKDKGHNNIEIETETVGGIELTHLFVSHGNARTGIRIDNPRREIPLIVKALLRHLAGLK